MKSGVIIVIILFASLRQYAGTYVSGTLNSPGIYTNNTSTGVIGWLNMGNVIKADGIYTTATAAVLGQYTNYLMVSGFKFNLPANAVVYGVSAQVKKTFSGLLGNITDNSVVLLKRGTVGIKNMALSGPWPSTNSISTYGDSTNLWGLTLSAADINDSAFGIAISAKLGGTLALTTAEIDDIQLRVYYGVALPVTLASFSASASSNEVLLTWSTDEEINNHYFAIERSINDIDFYTIDSVEGSGNSSLVKSYSYTDQSPLPGTGYYRLRQVDFNGRSQYSVVVSATLSQLPSAMAKIYPNPVRAGLPVTIKTLGSNQKLIKITDMNGTSYPLLFNDQNNQSIATTGFPQQMLAVLQDELSGEIKTLKFIVMQ